MAKYYVTSGSVRLVLDADNHLQAASKAFQWTSQRQATIQEESPLAFVMEAERRGLELGDELEVGERGFGDTGRVRFDTWDVIQHWQQKQEAVNSQQLTVNSSQRSPTAPALPPVH